MGSDMAHFLTSVRNSMLSCRRTQTIPQDFLYALDAHQLTLRSLLPHLDPPVPPEKTQPPLIAQPVRDNETQDHTRLLTNLLNDTTQQNPSVPQVPAHFPNLPSKHTYQFEEIYTSRETDPKKVRERATEDGRLGEGALRKLVNAHTSESFTPLSRPQSRKLPLQDQTCALWKATMEAILNIEREDSRSRVTELDPGSMDIDIADFDHPNITSYFGAPVNADRRYWRKGGVRRTTRPHAHGEASNGAT